MAMIPKPSEELFIGMELTIGRVGGRVGPSQSLGYFEARRWWFNMIGMRGMGADYTAEKKLLTREYRDWLRFWNEYCNWCRYTQKRGSPKWKP